MRENKSYLSYINILKSIGIILVVIGHGASGSKIEGFVGLFHMPLFFFIAGYLYKNKYDENIIMFINKKIKSLYIPYLKYSSIFLLLHNYLFYINVYSNEIVYGGKIIDKYNTIEYIKQFILTILFASREPMLGAFWFFATMFFSLIFFCGIRYFTKNINNKEIAIIIIILLLFMIGVYSQKLNINIPRFSNSFTMLLFIYLGFKFKSIENKIKFNLSTSVVSFFLLLVLKKYGKVAVNANVYTSPLFLILSAICGIYLVSYISQTIYSKRICVNFLEYVGQNTIVIMALHLISFKIVTLIQIKILNLSILDLAIFPVINKSGWWIIYTLVGVLLPITIKFSLEKIVLNLKEIITRENKKYLNY